MHSPYENKYNTCNSHIALEMRLTYALSMDLLRYDLYYLWLMDLRKCVMSAMCGIHVLYLFFIRSMHDRMKIFDVMSLYLFCVIYPVICITILFCHTHMHPTDAMI